MFGEQAKRKRIGKRAKNPPKNAERNKGWSVQIIRQGCSRNEKFTFPFLLPLSPLSPIKWCYRCITTFYRGNKLKMWADAGPHSESVSLISSGESLERDNRLCDSPASPRVALMKISCQPMTLIRSTQLHLQLTDLYRESRGRTSAHLTQRSTQWETKQ